MTYARSSRRLPGPSGRDRRIHGQDPRHRADRRGQAEEDEPSGDGQHRGLQPLSRRDEHHRRAERAKRTSGRPSGSMSEAIVIDPGYALAYWGAGYAYENLYFSSGRKRTRRRSKRCIAYFNKASELDPTFAETNLGLGWYYFNKGDNAKALRILQEGPRARARRLHRQPRRRGVPAEHRALHAGHPAARRGRQARASRCAAPGPDRPIVALSRAVREGPGCTRKAPWRSRATRTPGHACHPAHPDRPARRGGPRRSRPWSSSASPPSGLPFLRELVAALRAGGIGADAFADEPPRAGAREGPTPISSFGLKDEAIANIQAGIDRGFSNGLYLYSYPSLVGNPVVRGPPRRSALPGHPEETKRALYPGAQGSRKALEGGRTRKRREP